MERSLGDDNPRYKQHTRRWLLALDRALYALLRSVLSANLPSNGHFQGMNENFSLIVMCLFLLGSLAFLAQQLTSYH